MSNENRKMRKDGVSPKERKEKLLKLQAERRAMREELRRQREREQEAEDNYEFEGDTQIDLDGPEAEK